MRGGQGAQVAAPGGQTPGGANVVDLLGDLVDDDQLAPAVQVVEANCQKVQVIVAVVPVEVF